MLIDQGVFARPVEFPRIAAYSLRIGFPQARSCADWLNVRPEIIAANFSGVIAAIGGSRSMGLPLRPAASSSFRVFVLSNILRCADIAQRLNCQGSCLLA